MHTVPSNFKSGAIEARNRLGVGAGVARKRQRHVSSEPQLHFRYLWGLSFDSYIKINVLLKQDRRALVTPRFQPPLRPFLVRGDIDAW